MKFARRDVLAVGLSVLVPGAGQFYQGRARTGALFVALTFVVAPLLAFLTGGLVLGAGLLVLVPLVVITWVANVYDAATEWLL
ncbi:hypothetical protein VB779_17815 [Haloarculaceae archaeon H-GB11]|nr:hypothetical protein [Haloarculaceae archaeon H-GB11]